MPARSLSDFSPTLPLDDRRINIDPATKRIALRIASWDDVHAGSREVRMPRSVNLQAAHTGQAILDDGSVLKVATLPMDTMHAPLNVSAEIAASHYENTGTSVARVVYTADDIGIRADGVLFDDIDDTVQDRLLASAPSGDWKFLSRIRKPADIVNAVADFAGACLVNFPGFASEYSKLPGQTFTLAASGNSIIEYEEGIYEMTDIDKTANACGEACTTCTCGASAEAEVPAVALSADEIKNLVSGEVHEALVASGLIAEPAPELTLEERLAAVEAELITSAYDFDDE